MKFRPTINLWLLSSEATAKLQRGQWVSAGKPDAARNNCGVFCGVRPSGVIVVAWKGNAKAHRSPQEYRRTLMNFGRG